MDIINSTVFDLADENLDRILVEMLTKINPTTFKYPNLIRILSGLNNLTDPIPSDVLSNPKVLFSGTGRPQVIFGSSPPMQLTGEELRIYIDPVYTQKMAGNSNIYHYDNVFCITIFTHKNNQQIDVGATFPRRKINVVGKDMQYILLNTDMDCIRGNLVPVSPTMTSVTDLTTDFTGIKMLYKFTG